MSISDLILPASILPSVYGTYLLARSALKRSREDAEDSAPGWTGRYYSGARYHDYLQRYWAISGLLILIVGIVANVIGGLELLDGSISPLVLLISLPLLLLLLAVFDFIFVRRHFPKKALIRIILEEHWNRQSYWDEYSWNRALEFLSRRSMLSENLRREMKELLQELRIVEDSQLNPNLSIGNRNSEINRLKGVGVGLIQRAVNEELNVRWILSDHDSK